MGEMRSGRRARVWVQHELLPLDPVELVTGHGVGGRQASPATGRGGVGT
jgi:hypothetical protein